MITEQQLKQIAPNCKIVKELVVVLNQLIPKYNINTPLRLAHFFSQYAHETMGFTKFVENTNYTSADRLMTVFPKYFPNKLIATTYAASIALETFYTQTFVKCMIRSKITLIIWLNTTKKKTTLKNLL